MRLKVVRNIVLVSVVAVFLVWRGCRNDLIYYKYRGVTITRRSDDGTAYFCYGRIGTVDSFEKAKDISSMKVEYFGFSNAMDAQMVFHSDKRVEFMCRSMGSFTKIGADNNLYFRDYDNFYEDSIFKTYLKDSSVGIIRLSNSIDQEKEEYQEAHSNVDVQWQKN